MSGIVSKRAAVEQIAVAAATWGYRMAKLGLPPVVPEIEWSDAGVPRVVGARSVNGGTLVEAVRCDGCTRRSA